MAMAITLVDLRSVLNLCIVTSKTSVKVIKYIRMIFLESECNILGLEDDFNTLFTPCQ